MTRRQMAVWLSAALALAGVVALAGTAIIRAMELPPSDGQALAAIVQSVEKKDLGVIKSIEYEPDWWKLSGWWEISVCREACLKLYIDPKTGQEGRRKSDDLDDALPPANAKGPSEITKSFEGRNLGVITEIEFEDGVWQVKFREARGLAGALKPDKRRVFELVPSSWSKNSEAPRVAPPAQVRPSETIPSPDQPGLLSI